MIGSPDIDIMFSNTLPNLEIAKAYYQVDFEKFAMLCFIQ
jgi:UDP-N-acetylglucosamine 2-epimerase (hydrolysing)